jgi:hypothetical protein
MCLKKFFVLIFSLSIILKVAAQSYDYRNPWYAPFAQTSIWNTPIGSNAVLVNAGLPSSYYVCTDDEWLIRVDAATASMQPVNTPSSWGTRWPGNSAWWQGTMLVPNNLIIPDAAPPSTPNACSVFLMPDKQTIIQLEPTCRAVANQPIVFQQTTVFLAMAKVALIMGRPCRLWVVLFGKENC